MEIDNASLHKCLDTYFTSLKQSSLDDINKITMTDINFEAYKIDDDCKKRYPKLLKANSCLRGADALFEYNGIFYIIEFKNGGLSSKKISEVFEKMYASSIFVLDVLNLSIDDLRSRTNFILVYNYEKNKEYNDCNFDEIPASKLELRNRLRKHAHASVKDRDRNSFGLKKLEKYVYKEIFAIPDTWLKEYLIEENIIPN